MDGGKGLGSQSKDFSFLGVFKKVFMYLQLPWVLVGVHGLSLVVASGGNLLVVTHRLISVTFLVGSLGSRAQDQ